MIARLARMVNEPMETLDRAHVAKWIDRPREDENLASPTIEKTLYLPRKYWAWLCDHRYVSRVGLIASTVRVKVTIAGERRARYRHAGVVFVDECTKFVGHGRSNERRWPRPADFIFGAATEYKIFVKRRG